MLDPETGEVAFARHHNDAIDLMETQLDPLQLIKADYTPGMGWDVYHDSPAVKQSTAAILNRFK